MMKFRNLVASVMFASLTLSANANDSIENVSDLNSISEDLLECLRGNDCGDIQLGNQRVFADNDNFAMFGSAFRTMWSQYPHGDPMDVYQLIGGKVLQNNFENSCVIRVSRSMNYSGYPIPQNYPGLSVVSGADRKWYAYRVSEFTRYMLSTYGRPTVKYIGTDSEAARNMVRGKAGIIMFKVDFGNATGHFDLWWNSMIAHAEYFDMASEVFLWQ